MDTVKREIIRTPVFHQIHFLLELTQYARDIFKILAICYEKFAKPEEFALQNILRNCFNKVNWLIIMYFYIEVQAPYG